MIVLHKQMYWELSVKLMIYQIMLKCVKTHESMIDVIQQFSNPVIATKRIII